MNKQLLLLTALMPCAIMAQGEESGSVIPPAKVIGGVSDGRPSPPVVPKVLPKYKIHWSQTHHKNGQKITVNHVETPVKAVAPSVVPLSDKELARRSREFAKALGENKPSGGFFTVSATIYDHETTLVHWWHEGAKFSAYSNVDWNHLEGFASFEGRGKHYTMLLLSANTSMKSLGKSRQKGYGVTIPELPPLPVLAEKGPRYMVVGGDEKNEEAMEFIEAIHDLYAAEKTRLITAYTEREKNQKIRAKQQEELKRNPPPKKDVVINFWENKPAKKDQSVGKEAK